MVSKSPGEFKIIPPRIINFLTNGFPVWLLLASLFALVEPRLFSWFRGPLITIGLGIIMLGMGVTLTINDFKRVLKYPKWVALGVFLQYFVMPGLGWGLGYLFKLPTPYAVGLVLVSCCPGGTASNVISFLARVNVALSVTMTAISTLLAIMMTPFLTTLLVGNRVDVNSWGLLVKTFQVVLVPVAAGVILNRYCPQWTRRIIPYSPMVAVVFIVLIVASIIGMGRKNILESGFQLLGAVGLLHLLGFILGYVVSRILIREINPSRTISIEVGMQNSGLGVVLARSNFSNPMVAIPSALSSVFHSIIGSLFAAYWRKNPIVEGRGSQV